MYLFFSIVFLYFILYNKCMKKLIVSKKYDGKKLNKFLLENMHNLTNGLFCNTLRKKDIKINEKRINKDTTLHEGDEILVYIADSLLESKNQVKYSWGCFIRFQDRLFSKYVLWNAIKGNYFLGHIFPAASHGRYDTGNLVR